MYRNLGAVDEAYRKHLVGFVENEHLHGICLENAALDHVLDTARGANDNLRPVLESLHIIPDTGASNARMAFDIHEIADSDNNFLNLLRQLAGGSKDQCLTGFDIGVKLLQDGDGESCGFSGAGLGLCDNIGTLDDRHDSTLLNGRWTLEAICVDTYAPLAI